MNIKHAARSIIPPIALDLLNRRRRISFTGDYKSFDEALRDAEGYEGTESIAAAVNSAGGEAGEFLNERSMQLLGAIALLPERPVRILDVGGGSGSYFRILKSYFPGIDWTVAETPAMVAACQSFVEPGLSFTAEPSGSFDIVLMSGFVQYMPDPYAALTKYAAMGGHVIVTRCPIAERDRLTVQHVPSGGSYPAWFLSEGRILAALPPVIARWHVPQDIQWLDGNDIVYQGLLAAHYEVAARKDNVTREGCEAGRVHTPFV